jgi:CHASE3 domain sensor protein
MKRAPSQTKWLALGLLVLLVALGAALAVYYGTRKSQPNHPELLQQPTRARQVRLLHPGTEPGIPAPRIHPEKHAPDD